MHFLNECLIIGLYFLKESDFMNTSATIRNTGALETQTEKTQPQRCAPCALALLIIGLLGSALVAGIGLGAYLKIGVLTQLTHPYPLILIASGVGGGLACITAITIRSRCHPAPIIQPAKPDNGGEVAALTRGSLKQISLNTQQLMEQGFYRNARNEKIPLQSAQALDEETEIYAFCQGEPYAEEPNYTHRVSVIEKDCLDVAYDCVEKGDRVAVVLFAGPEEVGGGFIDGSGGGQEERIIYRSDLAALMKFYHDEQTADPDKFNATRYPLFTSLLHTPGVQIFRDSSFAVLDAPFEVGILTSAAPVSNNYQRTTNSFDLVFTDLGPDYAEEETWLLMKRIIYTQLKTAYDCGYDSLVLGAFGCGAFQNPAGVVAGLYKEIINTYFYGAFKEIFFAILEGAAGESNPEGNVTPFKRLFPD